MTKEDLQKFKQNLREIKLIKEQLKQLWSQMEGVRSSRISDMPKAPHTHDKLGELYAKYEPLHDEYTKRLTALYAEQKKIELEINQKLTGKELDVIKYHYILGLTQEAVAEKMHYEGRQVRRLLKDAIEKLECPRMS